MLDKKVCRKCFIKNYYDQKNAEWYWDNSVGTWPSASELWDEEQKTLCITHGKVSIHEPPPEWCSYVFQHAVAQGIKDNG